MPKTKVEVYDKDQLIYPFIESDHVTFSNGMKITEMLDQSISMPKVTHEDSSFKVGVGDQDVSSAIVDSSVADMTIKGQTYQNILPEPTLRNKMIGKSMQRLNEGYDNIEVVDGVSKSAILKGQTINNLWTKSSESVTVQGKTDDTTIELYSEQYDRVTYGETQVNAATTVGTKTTQLLQANKTYYINTFIFDADKSDTFLIRDIDNSINLETLKIEGYPVGQILSFTTQVETNGLRFYYFAYSRKYGAVNYGKPFYMPKRFIISDKLEDVVNQEFFEGMQSVKMPVLTTTGKNLFDENNVTVNPNAITIDDVKNTMKNGNINFYISKDEYWNGTFSYNNGILTMSPTSSYKGVLITINNLKPNSKATISYTFNGNGNIGGSSIPTVTVDNDGYCSFVVENREAVEYSISKIQIEYGESSTAYEPHKTNILHTPEEVVLKGLGDVQDTLNVNTGEYVQRVKEVIYTGEEDGWSSSQMLETPNNISFYIPLDNHLDNTNNPTMRELVKDNLGFTNNCRSATVNEPSLDGKKGFSIHNNGNVYFTIPTSECANLDAWKSRLRTQPLVLQYPVKNPIIKTVDLSSSGNWEKVVLDGSENWSMASESSNGNAFFRGDNTVPNNVKVNSNNRAQKVICDILTPFTQEQICNKPNDIYGISLGWNDSNLCVRHKDFPLTNEGLTQWKQYLQQNPVTVWYQTTTTQDNSIREMLSFANGHLQVSNEAENSLLPSVQYEIPTKNSYHMDLMKTNTLYTMKAKTVSGAFTIDGTSYNVNANGAFTSPSSMTDKLLVMSNKTNEEVMLLEGNVIDKTIPYFKGIKSAFEDEDKVEVLSTGKNLFDMNRRYDNVTNAQATVIQNIDEITVSSAESGTYVNANFVLDKNFFKGKTVTGSCLYESDMKGIGTVQINYRDTSGKNYYQSIKTSKTFTFPDEFVGEVLLCVYANNTNTPQSNTVTVKNIQLELGTKSTTYDSYKSNVSKIPLLSPLRSLPNGVYDEIILNRENNNVKMIRRVGRVVLNGEEDWTHEDKWHRWYSSCMNMARANDYATMILNNFENLPVIKNNTFLRDDTYGISGYELTSNYPNQNWIYIRPKNVSNTQAFQSLLSQNPTTVLYELATPIITEIDLEGYPYAYKDGHIFLNSDIAPTTQITYSINQAQQIESANENLQRHEKEISYLQKLIAQYIQVEYESTLLSLKV